MNCVVLNYSEGALEFLYHFKVCHNISCLTENELVSFCLRQMVTKQSSTQLVVTSSPVYLEYLAAETLFTLIARIMPSSSNSPDSPIARSKFMREIFLIPAFRSGKKMVQVLEDISKTDWDETAAVLIDILAADNINLCV